MLVDKPLASVLVIVPNSIQATGFRQRIIAAGGALGVEVYTFHALYAELLAGVARKAYEEAPSEVRKDGEALRDTLRLALRRIIRKTTQTRPLVIPVILEAPQA